MQIYSALGLYKTLDADKTQHVMWINAIYNWDKIFPLGESKFGGLVEMLVACDIGTY